MTYDRLTTSVRDPPYANIVIVVIIDFNKALMKSPIRNCFKTLIYGMNGNIHK